MAGTGLADQRGGQLGGIAGAQREGEYYGQDAKIASGQINVRDRPLRGSPPLDGEGLGVG